MKILFIQTGGTIDKSYPAGEDNHGYSFLIGSPAFERVLARINPSFDFDSMNVSQKDSLDINNDDRKLILEACRESEINRIVITHGTDTIIETAEFLGQLDDKIIVLTGALNPELFRESDADFNIGVAVGAASTLNTGVYVSMNGIVEPWSNITFNKSTNSFTAIS